MFSCIFDKCFCCFNQEPIYLPWIPNNTKHIEFIDVQSINSTIFLNTTVKQITNKDVLFRRCTDTKIFDEYISKRLPTIDEWNIQFNNYYFEKPLDQCLIRYCEQRYHDILNTLECEDDAIFDLATEYVNHHCFQTIQYVSIRSRQLNNIGNGGFLANHKVNWVIMELSFDYSLFNPRIIVDCNAFQFLKHLRILKINVLSMPNFKCILDFNPDLAVFIWRGIRIWNTCKGQLTIWVHNEQYDEADFFRKIMKTQEYSPTTLNTTTTTITTIQYPTRPERKPILRKYYLQVMFGIIILVIIIIYLKNSSYGNRFWILFRDIFRL